MSGYELQKYYLINLSTRNISISTHLRQENFTLKSGKCIYLGNLTDELVVKYHRYSALNISLRILTKDKVKQIIPKCINATENLLNSLLGNETLREEHSAGSIENVDVFVKSNKVEGNVLTEEKEDVVKSSKNVVKETTPTTNASISSANKKEEVVEQQKQEEPKHEENSLGESVIVNQEDLNNESENKNVDLTDGLPVEVNVIEESIKQDVKDMSYNQLYDLAKARGLIKKGRPSRDKIIALLTSDVENGGQL